MNFDDETDCSKRLIRYNELLPYADELEKVAEEVFAEIKLRLASCLSLAEIRPGLVTWIYHLHRYISLHGHRFSREDHLELVQLFLDIIFLPDIDFGSIQALAGIISLLLSPTEETPHSKLAASLETFRKKYLLSPEDLTIEWRPLYDLTERCNRDNSEFYGLQHRTQDFETQINALVRACRPFFPVTATQEMLDEWLVDLCPVDAERDQTYRKLRHFLPTTLPPKHYDKGWKLWFDHLMSLWLLDRRGRCQFILGGLFARLAEDNVGHIDWEPHLAHVFTRLLRSFSLPYGSGDIKARRAVPAAFCETTQLTRWVVACLGGGSSAQKMLEQLFKTVESFYHPSNLGRWSTKLNKFLAKLADGFLERLFVERYKEKTWENQVPERKKLSEADIDDFVESVRPILLTTIFAKLPTLNGNKALLALAGMRPQSVIPPLLEKLNEAFCNLTEPHRLISTLTSLEYATRPLVLNHSSLRTSVDVPSLLMGCLPGIDSNDTRKTSVTFRVISTLVAMIPLIDCSSIADEVAPELQQICLATSVFEEFVLELLTRCFVVVENVVADMNHQRENHSTLEDDITGFEMRITFLVIFRQCPPALYRSAVDKLYSFVNNRILDPVTGKMISTIVRCAVAANPVYGLEIFLPHFSKLALTLMESDEVLGEEKVDNELLFSLVLCADLAIAVNSEALYPYVPTIIRVVRRGLKLTAKSAYLAACQLLQYTFRCLVSLYAMPFGEAINPTVWDKSDPPVLHWGESADLRTITIDWHTATEQDLVVAKEVHDSCVSPELDALEKWCSDPQANPMTKEALHKSLSAVWSSLQGLGSSLPELKGEIVNVSGTKTPSKFEHVRHLGQKCFDEMLRERILDLMERVVDTIFTVCEDDIRALNTVSRILTSIVFYFGVTKREYEISFRGHKHYGSVLYYPLCIEEMRYIRHVIVDRALIQHKLRLHFMRPPFTSNHVRAMKLLFRMAISHYSLVRMTAQESLHTFFYQYSRSYEVLLDDICGLLSTPEITHDQYKGILYTLLGTTEYRIFPINNWKAMRKLWPALIQAPHSEKPSIITLFSRLQDQLIVYMDGYPIISRMPVKIIERAELLCGKSFDAAKCPSECVENGAGNRDAYNSLVEKLTEMINSGELHWRHHFFGLVMIKMLLRDDVHYGVDTVRMVSNHLISEHLRTRKICIDILAGILYQQKKKMKKIKVSREHLTAVNASTPLNPTFEKCLAGGEARPFNLFLQFNSVNHPDTEEKWNKAIFVHKPYVGYSGFKSELEVYAPDADQPEIAGPGNMNPVEQTIFNFFSKPEYIEKLMYYLSIEENKGKDKFDGKRIALFKMLFRNYGDLFVEFFLPYLQKFIQTSQHESEQRCALEILAGMVRGAKHWNFHMSQRLAQFVTPLIEEGSANILQETVADWGVCVATILESRDCNKYYWFYELISRGIFVGTPFQQSCKMYYLLGGVTQMSWRTMELAHRLLGELTPNLAHPYLNVRKRMAHLLAYVFSCDIRKNDGELTSFDIPDNFVLAPKSLGFLNEVGAGLASLKLENHEQEKEVAKRLFQTLLKWQIFNCSQNASIHPKEALLLLPIACRFYADTSNEELQKDCCLLVTVFGYEMLSTPTLYLIMQQVQQRLNESFWRVRDFAISLFRFATFSNLFAISSDVKLSSDVKDIVLRAINDERVEVRATAQAALSGLIHCGLIDITDDLLVNVKTRLRTLSKKFKACRAKSVLASRKSMSNTSSDHETVEEDPNGEQRLLIDYHAAILLLCAYINAHPYDVPVFMPDVICVLADHLHAPQPVSTTIKNTLSEFKRTHYDNWRDHKDKFSNEQLTTITDLLVSPSYYA